MTKKSSRNLFKQQTTSMTRWTRLKDPENSNQSRRTGIDLQRQLYSMDQAPPRSLQNHARYKNLNHTSGKFNPHNINKRHDSDKEDINPAASFQDCKTYLAEMSLDPEPNTRRQAVQSLDATKWIDVMQDEDDGLIKNSTWGIVDHPDTQHIHSNRWVPRRKPGANGKVQKPKARFVIRGFERVCGVDLKEMLALVVR